MGITPEDKLSYEVCGDILVIKKDSTGKSLSVNGQFQVPTAVIAAMAPNSNEIFRVLNNTEYEMFVALVDNISHKVTRAGAAQLFPAHDKILSTNRSPKANAGEFLKNKDAFTAKLENKSGESIDVEIEINGNIFKAKEELARQYPDMEITLIMPKYTN
ncbi:MAG: hypothetical protein K0R67_2168 [Paenibacillus sp.]|nr:hypothetical protein [Paenibacillus sp.]